MTEGYKEIPAGGAFSTHLVCERCSALVWERAVHDQWHARTDAFTALRDSVASAMVASVLEERPDAR